MAETLEEINRASPVPYYQQLFEVLERRLSVGLIAKGEKLPSENELGAQFGLARATVRQALQLLESHGLVQRVANRGVFAADGPAERGWMIQGPQGFLENAVGHQNRSVTTEVLRAGETVLPDLAARSLDVPDGSTGFELIRVRSLDGTPALYSINHSPPAVAPVVAAAADVLSGNASLSDLLAGAGYVLGGAQRTVYAVAPGAEIASILGVSKSAPVLRIRSVSWTSAGERYDVYETWVRSDVIPLEINVSTVDLSPKTP
ncbi:MULTISPECIES: GntR family transcriptional regulator [unclassified Frondihabitans]|uniref:GntR family transcriptional regulator n=1 Tax=unclassified Frondihabitans TaxID=2626248 RepID=UPI000F5141EA|nr:MULTISPECIES: GntR family transcriptional regulator [unclassified Frondihabitans]RPE77842.1 GntR family transcriptional regulator [Frondihabitans sp. PhB153]RPF08121.1 GntR family transcriptional regulator [Frondihabitans sp. PhB161]